MNKGRKTEIQESRIISNIIDLSILIYIVSIYVFSFSETDSIISTYCAIPCLVLLALYTIRHGFYIYFTAFEKIFLLFIGICILSCIWAINSNAAFSKCLTLIQIFVFTTLLHKYILENNKFSLILFSVAVAGLALCIYEIKYFGLDLFLSMMISGQRIGYELMNVNVIGIQASTSAIILIWYGMYYRKRYAFLLAVLCLAIGFSTGSRKSILIFITGLIFLFLFKDQKTKKIKNILLLCLVLFTLFYILQTSAILNTVSGRLQGLLTIFNDSQVADSSTIHRLELVEIGIRQFMDTPFTGVGIGNARYVALREMGRDYYLHNNYIELLAGVGLFGTLSYYLLFFKNFSVLHEMTKKKNNFAAVILTLLITEAISQVGVVHYYDKLVYVYILCGFVLVEWQANHHV